MNEPSKKDKLISLGATIALHVLVAILLVFMGFKYKAPDEESGILLMVGTVDLSAGDESSYSESMESVEPETSTDVLPDAQTVPETTSLDPVPDQPLIAQNTEEAPAISAEEKDAEAEARKKAEESRLRAEAEAKKIAEEEAQRKAEEARRKAEEEARKRAAAQNLVAGAFGNNSGTGTTANGVQGSINGNSNNGASSGTAGYGQYDLGGRGIIGSLPRPTFNVNASGKVVVRITVNVQGVVVGADIAPGTTTSSQTLRTAALEAARKAHFEVAEIEGNQQGTITYLFDSNN